MCICACIRDTTIIFDVPSLICVPFFGKYITQLLALNMEARKLETFLFSLPYSSLVNCGEFSFDGIWGFVTQAETSLLFSAQLI